MSQMISITTRRQTLSRSWIWDRKRRSETAENKPEEQHGRDEPAQVKQASWPRPRASWLPPLTQ